MNKITTVIFDLDGTLLNTLEDLTDAVNHALKAYNYPERTIEEVRAFVGNGVRNLMIRALPEGEANPQFEEVFNEFKEYYGKHCNDKTCPYDGVLDLMRELKERGYKLAIVSNKLHSAVLELDKLYFDKYTETVCGDKEGLKRKPAPDSCFEVMKIMKVNKEECVYVGDSDVDLQTAKNASLPCISVLWGFRDKDFLIENGAKIFAGNPQDILQILESEL